MPVDYHQYSILAGPDDPDESRAVEVVPGFISWEPGSLSVISAQPYGSLPVDIDQCKDAPSLDCDEWEDVAEVSLTANAGQIRLWQLMGGPRGPNLAFAGPGSYRLRLAAKGRDGKHELHLIQVWLAPETAPVAVKRTSSFSTSWDAPQRPEREIDWGSLAATPGVRLIVGWRQLRQPHGTSPSGPVDVTVSQVVEGTPRAVFDRFHNNGLGGLVAGTQTGMAIDTRPSFWGDVIRETYSPEFDGKPTSIQRWIGNLRLVGRVINSQRYRRFTTEFGFEEPRKSGIDWRPHPIPPGSTEVDFHFAKHAAGRIVSIKHRNVPSWLADDVRALWEMVLRQNVRYMTSKAPMPWEQWTLSDYFKDPPA